MREQKLQEQRLHQEERLKRALERAQADPKRTVSLELTVILFLMEMFFLHLLDWKETSVSFRTTCTEASAETH